MRIAIIGAGFCGLATAWFLAQHKIFDITLIDAKHIGQGTSGIAAGLLHGYAGAHSKRNWRATEGLAATHQLLQVAQETLNAPVATRSGILRTAITPLQIADFTACAQANHSDVQAKTAAENVALMPNIVPAPGIFISSGCVVDCQLYLQGLWQACMLRGVQFEQRHVTKLAELDSYDHIIVAAGAATNQLPELKDLRLKAIKGQILELAWPNAMPPLPCPLNSQAYLIMHHHGLSCTAGATFEREFNTLEPNLDVAVNEIMPKLQACIHGFEHYEILACRAGVRAATPDHKPLLLKHGANCWVLTGMGSKGLLYHALFAKELVEQVVSSYKGQRT